MRNPFNRKIDLKRDGRTFGWGASPDSDWKVIFITTMTLALLVGAWDALTYFKVRSGDLAAGVASGESENATLNKESLKRAVEYYQAKEIEFEKLKRGSATTTTATDPSL